MSEAKKGNSGLTPLLCGCGQEVRYSHFKNGNEVTSCNKYVVCPTYDEQKEKIAELQSKYSELLYAIERKFPGESRHETALRYIRAMEDLPSCEDAQCETAWQGKDIKAP